MAQTIQKNIFYVFVALSTTTLYTSQDSSHLANHFGSSLQEEPLSTRTEIEAACPENAPDIQDLKNAESPADERSSYITNPFEYKNHDETFSFHVRSEKMSAETRFEMKDTTVFVYIAGRNDLDRFVLYNLNQLKRVGTTDKLNIIVYLHTIQGRKQITQRFIVYKDRLVQIGDDVALDSGDLTTLIQGASWAFTHFPAKTKVVILWNHGTGAIEPHYRVAINPSELYIFNPITNMIEINRSIGFMDYLALCNTTECRGICFDNATKHYLTNRDVGVALRTVCDTCLGGEPFDILCCDACLMLGIEPAFSLKQNGKPPVAKYFVGSQEVVLATGYPYTALFATTAVNPQTPEELAKHIVLKFAQYYAPLTQDYTQSAVDLTKLDPLYESIDVIATLLIQAMENELHSSAHAMIARSGSKENCTYFEEPTYKDMHHLFSNMRNNLGSITLRTPELTNHIRHQLQTELSYACKLIKQAVIANAAGHNLSHASGLSIYLPQDRMHASYAFTDFGSNSLWTKMLHLYLKK